MKKSFELEDYKPPFRQGSKHHAQTGPRRTGGTGFWYKFCMLFPQYKSYLKKPSDITKIIRTFHENMANACVDNRAGVEFPERLGVLFIGSYKAGDRSIDHATSEKLLKRVPFRSLNTDGYSACIYYDVTNCNYIHNELWDFNASDPFRKKVSESFRKNWNKYAKLENYWNIARRIKKSFIKDFMLKKETELLKDYNEFYIV